jgi:LETM1 and EF-hand domain-containing protein 1
MERIKDEIMHYWDGSKLLAAETKISSRLLLKLLKGKELSRREYRQLRRTTGDLLRLVPLVIILVIPFLEFALPVLLKVFPSMLPSTFESKGQEEERRRNLLMVRLNMAKFLQETVAEVALSGTGKQDAAKEFNEFFSKVIQVN